MTTASEREAPNPLVRDCDIGFGIGVEKLPNGRGYLFVPKQVIAPGFDGPALRAFMEETAVAWLEQVAPHRLAGAVRWVYPPGHWVTMTTEGFGG